MIVMHRICDRCKKEEIIDDVQKNYLTAGEPRYVPHVFPKYIISSYDENSIYKEINLCKDCEKDFELFLTEFDIPKE